MKVLCVKEGIWINTKRNVPEPIGPKYGEVVTVIDEDEKYYHLAEYPINSFGKAWYKKDKFIPISGKDETEYADQVLERMFISVLDNMFSTY